AFCCPSGWSAYDQ
nr:RecName: Full=Snaclec coagulation factor X-activating enzyme light chain 2; AltName: Full=Factor X activator LC2 [Vipera aspis aspis]